MYSDYKGVTHAKWILAGEHAVLRGHPALVFPVPSLTLTLEYHAGAEAVHADFAGSAGADTHLLFWSVLEQGLEWVGQNLSEVTGHFQLTSYIPIGAGMGASAALCAGIAKWLSAQGFMREDEIFGFAQRLENLFHSESSGVDIAGTLATQGTEFTRPQHLTPLTLQWQPQWFLSASGQVGITAHCVNKVKELWQRDPVLADSIDQTMAKSVKLAKQALAVPLEQGLPQLVESIELARSCFQQWHLISDNVAHHSELLMKAGALATKPTGSGDGGYILSLWDKPPPTHLSLRPV